MRRHIAGGRSCLSGDGTPLSTPETLTMFGEVIDNSIYRIRTQNYQAYQRRKINVKLVQIPHLRYRTCTQFGKQ